jgi:hypothetical protein
MYLHGEDRENFTCIFLDLSINIYSASHVVFLAIVHMTKVSMKTLPYVTAQVSMFSCVTHLCSL